MTKFPVKKKRQGCFKQLVPETLYPRKQLNILLGSKSQKLDVVRLKANSGETLVPKLKRLVTILNVL